MRGRFEAIWDHGHGYGLVSAGLFFFILGYLSGHGWSLGA